ncbi:MAG: RNA polymerase sigma-70 factor [Cyclobacteriaceae bacterium]
MISERIKNGDRAAFEELFHTYYASLCRFAFKYVRDTDEAEEIVQDTYVNFWNRRNEIKIEASLKSYLFTAVRNKCLNHIKHDGVVREHAQFVLETHSESDHNDSMVTDELASRIKAAVESMPEQRKRIFRMSRDEGLRYREIADHLQISVKTVENHMGKALQYLRLELSDFLVLIIYFIINEVL